MSLYAVTKKYSSQFNNDFSAVLFVNVWIDGIYMMYKVFRYMIRKYNSEYDDANTHYTVNANGEIDEYAKVFELKLNNRKK